MIVFRIDPETWQPIGIVDYIVNLFFGQFVTTNLGMMRHEATDLVLVGFILIPQGQLARQKAARVIDPYAGPPRPFPRTTDEYEAVHDLPPGEKKKLN